MNYPSFFYLVSPEKSYAVSLSSNKQSLLFSSGDRITLAWNPKLLVPSSFDNNVTVDISIYYQDYDEENQQIETIKLDQLETSLNDGESVVLLRSYSLACSSGKNDVTFTVCPIYFKVSISENQYLPSGLAVWSSTAYYKSPQVSDFDLLDQCETWRQNEERRVPLLERFQQSEPCPPTRRFANWDREFQIENRSSIFVKESSYPQMFQNYFHSGTSVCYRLNW